MEKNNPKLVTNSSKLISDGLSKSPLLEGLEEITSSQCRDQVEHLPSTFFQVHVLSNVNANAQSLSQVLQRSRSCAF